MAKLLVVDDDAELANRVRDWLIFQGHTVEAVYDGNDGWDRARFYKYDAIVLDWNMPGRTGVEICKELRSAGIATPVIMLTAKREIEDKEAGFEAGADDYLAKPFELKELSARIKALLRRPPEYVQENLVTGRLTLEASKRRAFLDGEEIQLKGLEFALLEFFMRHPEQVFSPEALLDRVWSSESEASVGTIRTYVKTLRQKLHIEGQPSMIQTVHGSGYKFQPPAD